MYFQVPESSLNFVSGDCGGSVVDIKPSLPDLETLLSDISNTLEQQSYNQSSFDMDTTPLGESYRTLDIEQPYSFQVQDEITMYDDLPLEQKPKLADLQKQLTLPLTNINTPAPVPSQEQTTLTVMPVSVSHDPEMDEARKEVDGVCLQLGIPAGGFSYVMNSKRSSLS